MTMLRPSFQRSFIRRINETKAESGETKVALEAFTAENMMAQAQEKTGLSDFGNETFFKPMDVLFADMRANPHIHFTGLKFAERFFLMQLMGRLKLVQSLKEEPAIKDQSINKPMIVVGLPRTGSTRMMRLLGRDPAHRNLRTWEAVIPAPPPPAQEKPFDKRRFQAMLGGTTYQILAPDILVMHPIGADLPEECILLHATSFDSWMFPLQDDVPSYEDWYLQADHTQTYVEHKEQLQCLQWNYKKERWLLKSPGHMFGVRELLKTYPDALIVQTHRDPRKIMPSLASLTSCMRGVRATHVDEGRVADQVLRQVLHGLNNLESFVPEIPDNQYVGVQYQDLMSDPMGELERIYERFGLEISPEARAGFEDEIVRNPKNKKGKHTYSMERFGWSDDYIADQFADYIGRNRVPTES